MLAMLAVEVRATVLRGPAETSDPAPASRAPLPLRSSENRAPRGPAHTRAQGREVLIRFRARAVFFGDRALPRRLNCAALPFDNRRQEFTNGGARYSVIMKTAPPSEVFAIYWRTNFSDRWFEPGREMRRANRLLFDPPFVEIHQIGDADDLLGAIGAAHVGERGFQEIATGCRHAFLHVVPVPLGDPHFRREQREQPPIALRIAEPGRHALMDDCFHRRRVDPEVQAEKFIHASLVILRVARGQRTVRFHVTTLGQKSRQVQQPCRRVGHVRRGQLGQHFPRGSGNRFGQHIPNKPTPALCASPHCTHRMRDFPKEPPICF